MRHILVKEWNKVSTYQAQKKDQEKQIPTSMHVILPL